MVLVLVDRFSKMAHFISTRSTDMAAELHQQFLDNVVR
jgi:hypothetical protein